MTRPQIARDTARALRAADLSQYPALLGFDGFVDDIIDVVAQRPDARRYDHYARIPSLADFGTRIAATAGHGTNFELFIKRQKLGGQGPIMGNALALLGMPLTYIGSVGDGGGGIHTVFRDFASRATCISLADAARTHALEFTDGKLMLGELAPLSQLTFPRLLEVVGREKLLALCQHAALLGLLNWTMLPSATALWRSFAEEIIPRLARPPRIFIDLADPKKRSPADLAEAMTVLTQLNAAHAPVTLGLNEAESTQVANAIGISPPSASSAPPITNYQLPITSSPLRARAAALRQQLQLDTVVIHPTACAVVATATGTAEFPGPYVKNPAILTGGGDHFNAGFALAQLLGLPLENALCLATAASGYYVRHAASPTAAALAQFLDDLPEPQSA